MVSVCLVVACANSATERVDTIAEILLQRAEHLNVDECHEIARGLVQAESRTGVDVFLLLAMVEEESHFRIRARSHRGALGLMQVRPETGRDVARRNRIAWDGQASLLKPSRNLIIGATYLSELKDRFGSWDLALTAYHQGPGRAKSMAARGRRPSSRYAGRVLRRTESLRQATIATTDRQPGHPAQSSGR